MNWLAWCLGGLLLLAVWVLVMFLAAFSDPDPPFVAICVFFGALALAWLAFGVFAVFGVSLSISLEGS